MACLIRAVGYQRVLEEGCVQGRSNFWFYLFRHRTFVLSHGCSLDNTKWNQRENKAKEVDPRRGGDNDPSSDGALL